jgi:PadR family transcriptional regulator, regulatory protein PadR
MSKVKFLGEFEIIVMAALTRLGEDAYGVSVIAEIERRAGRKTSIGDAFEAGTEELCASAYG